MRWIPVYALESSLSFQWSSETHRSKDRERSSYQGHVAVLDQHKVVAHLTWPDNVLHTVHEKEPEMHSPNLFDAHSGFFPSLCVAVGRVPAVNAAKVVQSSHEDDDDRPVVLLLARSKKQHGTWNNVQ